MEEKKRIEWIDIARGLGILFVIIGHTMTTPIRYASYPTYWTYGCIYFFHMPLMFYLSGRTYGMFIQRNLCYSPGGWIKKKWNTLMVPYLVYGTLVYCIFTIANAIPTIGVFLENAGYGKRSFGYFLKGTITMYGDDLYCIHLWFIYALFIMNIVSYFIMKYCKYHKILLFTIAIFFISIRIIFIEINYWGIINLFMKCYLWFVLGTYVDLSKWATKWIGRIWAILAIVYMWLFVIDFGQYRSQFSDLSLEVIKWIADIGIIMGVIQVAIWMKGILKKFFIYTGRNSYGIYLFHQPFFASGGGAILYKVLGLPLIVSIIITFVMCYVFPIIIINLLNTKYLCRIKPYLLGTPRKKRV